MDDVYLDEVERRIHGHVERIEREFYDKRRGKAVGKL